MFEKAVRMKLRWQFRGGASSEDLWDLPVEALDTIFRGLSRLAKAQAEESLLEPKTEEDEVLSLKVSIVKHIVKTKLAEAKARQNEALKAARKQKLMGLVAHKQDEALLDLDLDELQELIDEL